MSAEGRVRCEVSDGVARLILDRPAKLNALAGSMRDALFATLQRVGQDGSVRVVGIQGEGKAFCAGGDVDAMIAMKDAGEGPGPIVERMETGAAVVRAMRDLPVPVVALVHGVAAGAGAALASACDLVWADPDARFFFSWSKLGLHPDWGASWTLPRRVGSAKALHWCLTGDAVDVASASAAGLVDLVAPRATWEDRLAALAASAPPTATRWLKANVASAGGRTLEEGLAAEALAQAECWDSEDVARGLRAFAERKKSGRRG